MLDIKKIIEKKIRRQKIKRNREMHGKLLKLKNKITLLSYYPFENKLFPSWYSSVVSYFAKNYGLNSLELKQFEDIDFFIRLHVSGVDTNKEDNQQYQNGLILARRFLRMHLAKLNDNYLILISSQLRQ